MAKKNPLSARVPCQKGTNASAQFYIDANQTLPLSRFLPKPPIEKGAASGGSKQKGETKAAAFARCLRRRLRKGLIPLRGCCCACESQARAGAEGEAAAEEVGAVGAEVVSESLPSEGLRDSHGEAVGVAALGETEGSKPGERGGGTASCSSSKRPSPRPDLALDLQNLSSEEEAGEGEEGEAVGADEASRQVGLLRLSLDFGSSPEQRLQPLSLNAAAKTIHLPLREERVHSRWAFSPSLLLQRRVATARTLAVVLYRAENAAGPLLLAVLGQARFRFRLHEKRAAERSPESGVALHVKATSNVDLFQCRTTGSHLSRKRMRTSAHLDICTSARQPGTACETCVCGERRRVSVSLSLTALKKAKQVGVEGSAASPRRRDSRRRRSARKAGCVRRRSSRSCWASGESSMGRPREERLFWLRTFRETKTGASITA